MQNCIANEVEYTQNNKQLQLHFDYRLTKNFMVVATAADTMVNWCKEVKRTCPRAHSKSAAVSTKKSFCS